MAKKETQVNPAEDLVQEDIPSAEEKQEAAAEEKLVDDGMVTVKLFRDNEKYKDDVFVAVNGRRIQVKRGVEVRIPRAHAEVLANAMKQRNESFEYMDGLASDFKRQSEALKI